MCQSAFASRRSACASGCSKLLAEAADFDTDLGFDMVVMAPAGETERNNTRAPTAGNVWRNTAAYLELSPTARESTGSSLRRQRAVSRRPRLRIRARPRRGGDKH